MIRNTLIFTVLLMVAFLGWRFLRPMQIFNISSAFERPIDTDGAPAMFQTLGAEECASCHRDFYNEWNTTIHSQAWTDPYFQVDWKFDGSAQICKNCHIPLDRQQEYLVTGFRDDNKWDPILTPNPAFDEKLQHEGVTCNVCHLRNGKILGVLKTINAPHPVELLKDANQICLRCHVVSGRRWDTFYKMPPCGTVAEIRTSHKRSDVEAVENMSIDFIASLGCVECHMPLIERPMVEGGAVRKVRQHLWRGGHDPDMVKQGLSVSFTKKTAGTEKNNHSFVLSLRNTGAEHYLPTGTPDRHLTVRIRAFDRNGAVVKEERYKLKRIIMWRPFIVDLWDTRLPRGEKRDYVLELNNAGDVAYVKAEVSYHLLDEARRRRIEYKNKSPIQYPVFQQKIPVTLSTTKQQPYATNKGP